MPGQTDPGLQSAIAEAVEGVLESSEDEEFDDSWNSWDNEGGAVPTETPSNPDASQPDAPGESQSQTAETHETPENPEGDKPQEVPEEFWGTDLSDIPAEKRAEIIARFEQQESTIHKLQQRLAEPKEQAPPVEEEPDVLTDADILLGLGIDPDDYSVSDAAKAAMLRQARATMALEARVEEMTMRETTREVETQWNTALDDLEKTYGRMPGSRLEQLQYAVDERISSPEALYFRLTAPVKREVEEAAAQARRDVLRQEVRGQVKPRGSGAEPVLDLKGVSLRDAVKLAAKDAEKETGIRFRDAVKRKLIKSE